MKYFKVKESLQPAPQSIQKKQARNTEGDSNCNKQSDAAPNGKIEAKSGDVGGHKLHFVLDKTLVAVPQGREILYPANPFWQIAQIFEVATQQ